jgi:hypothetical protein
MLALNGMGRRRKSNEAAYFEAIATIIGLGVLFGLISPEFRHWMQIILLILVVAVVIATVIWVVLKTNRPAVPSSPFETPRMKRHRTEDAIHNRPPTIGEELQSVQFVPERTISEKLRNIDWFQFEKLIELIYQRRGFSVKRLGGANPDGGVDLIIESSNEKFVVQCKHWRKWTVGVRHIREFLGTLTDSGISKGIFVTLIGYSADAKQLADKHGIQILNESDIVRILEDSGLMYSNEIYSLISDQRKFCPKCEKEMVLRTARVKGNQFWGCSSFPRCRFVINIQG